VERADLRDRAVADRLARPEGDWRPFDRSGWRAVVFPKPVSA